MKWNSKECRSSDLIDIFPPNLTAARRHSWKNLIEKTSELPFPKPEDGIRLKKVRTRVLRSWELISCRWVPTLRLGNTDQMATVDALPPYPWTHCLNGHASSIWIWLTHRCGVVEALGYEGRHGVFKMSDIPCRWICGCILGLGKTGWFEIQEPNLRIERERKRENKSNTYIGTTRTD